MALYSEDGKTPEAIRSKTKRADKSVRISLETYKAIQKIQSKISYQCKVNISVEATIMHILRMYDKSMEIVEAVEKNKFLNRMERKC